MTHFHAGQNMPGYLPESDVATFGSFGDAKRFMIVELDRAGDSIFEAGETEEERGIADEYSAAMEELNLEAGPEWGVILPSSTSEHDLGLSFWINACDELECEIPDEDPYDAMVRRFGIAVESHIEGNNGPGRYRWSAVLSHEASGSTLEVPKFTGPEMADERPVILLSVAQDAQYDEDELVEVMAGSSYREIRYAVEECERYREFFAACGVDPAAIVESLDR
jgi:hypothetical protein